MPISARTTINGETLSLFANEAGSVCVSQYSLMGETQYSLMSETMITFSGSTDLSVIMTGNLDATVIGSIANDIFDFSSATGDYKLRTQAGNDRIIDGVGDSVFNGGAGLDAFAFDAEGGRMETDRIVNYVVTDDQIEVVNGTITSVVQTTSDQVTVTLSDGDQIYVEGMGIKVADIVFI
jgi:Ca2+-binding RTX toxin-like protein